MKMPYCRCPDGEPAQDDNNIVLRCTACNGWLAVKVCSEADLAIFEAKYEQPGDEVLQ